MAASDWTIIDDYSPGYRRKRDLTQEPPGALILGSKNVVITDGDRISPRPGSSLLGAGSSTASGCKSSYTYKKRSGTEIPIRTYGTVVEYYNSSASAWANLNSGYTSAQVFGFTSHNVNTDAVDYVYYGNGREPLTRWTGTFDKLSGDITGASTEIGISGSVFEDDILYSGTASSATDTTITMPAGTWGVDIWNDFYVRITDGTYDGKVSKITDTTATTITFGAITGLNGTTPQFEIRRLRFDDSNMKLRIGTTDVTYTGYTDQGFTGVSGAPTASTGDAVCQAVEELKEEPRGSILLTEKTRLYVSGAPVAGRDSATTGSACGVYYSAIANASDFSFSSPRSADEGGVVDFPEGGGPVRSLAVQEDKIYVIKEDVIKTLSFTQDGNDLPEIYPLLDSPQVGTVGQKAVFKVDNAIFHISPDGGLKQTTRSSVVEFAQPLQLSDPISEEVGNLYFDSDTAGIFFDRKAYVACKSSSSATFNDTVIVYNFQKKAWEAPITGWNVGSWLIYGDSLYFCSSTNPETYKVDPDQYDDGGAPFEAVARFAYLNFGTATHPKEFTTMFLEGFISENTTLDITVRYDYLGGSTSRSATFSGTEEDYIIYTPSDPALGLEALGINPLGAIEEEESPNDLQKFRVFFTTQAWPFTEISLEIKSNDSGDRWELLRFGMDAKLKEIPITSLKKQLT